MNGAVRKLLHVFRFSALRIVRQPASTIIMVGLPLLMIPIMGSVFSKIGSFGSFLDGAPDAMAFFAVGIVVLFQLMGGRFSMEGIRDSLLTERKWRIHSAPCSPGIHAMGILGASALVSLLQGVLLVLFCRLFLGVRWGSAPAVLLILLGTGLLAQLAFVALVLVTRSYGAAAALGWLFAYGSSAAGGLVIPLPAGSPFCRFVADYGTPYSLAQTALVGAARGGPWGRVALCTSLLYALSALLALAVALLGKRRLA